MLTEITIKLISRFLRFTDNIKIEMVNKNYYDLFKKINFKSIIKKIFKFSDYNLEYNLLKTNRAIELSKRYNLSLSIFRKERINTKKLTDFHTIKINRINKYVDLHNLKDINNLEINNCRDINLNDLENNTIQKIEIDFGRFSTKMLNQKLDLNTILNIPDIVLYFNRAEYKFKEIDIDILKNNKKISIIGSKYFNQIDKFRYLSCVQLIECKCITDISSLSNVEIVCVTSCQNLRKLGKLTNVKSLDVQRCYYLEDLTGAENVEILNLTDCSSIIDLSPLKKVRGLAIGGCLNLRLPEGYFGNHPIITDACGGSHYWGSMKNYINQANGVGNRDILKSIDFLKNLEYIIDDIVHCIYFTTIEHLKRFYAKYTIDYHYKKFSS